MKKDNQRREWKRSTSFAIVLAVYLGAIVVGILVYEALPFEVWLKLLLADVAATIFTFLFSCIFHNASVYDPYWSVQPIVILVYATLKHPLNPLRLLMLVAVSLWGIRLTGNWAYTFHGLGSYEDWRYRMLREQTGPFYPVVNLLGIHLFPTLVVYGCVLPAVYVFLYDTGFYIWNAFLFLVSLGAALLQLVSDTQMHRYRKHPDGPFMRHGLWKYARHPNYLGEIMMWWGIGLSAYLVLPGRYYLLAGALVNTLMFLFISIPMQDNRQARKPGFEEYKTATHRLIPLQLFLPKAEEEKN